MHITLKIISDLCWKTLMKNAPSTQSLPVILKIFNKLEAKIDDTMFEVAVPTRIIIDKTNPLTRKQEAV